MFEAHDAFTLVDDENRIRITSNVYLTTLNFDSPLGSLHLNTERGGDGRIIYWPKNPTWRNGRLLSSVEQRQVREQIEAALRCANRRAYFYESAA